MCHLACPRGILNNVPVQHLHTFYWEEGRTWGRKSPAADWVRHLTEAALLWKASVLSSLQGGMKTSLRRCCDGVFECECLELERV